MYYQYIGGSGHKIINYKMNRVSHLATIEMFRWGDDCFLGLWLSIIGHMEEANFCSSLLH